jgi:hypothetical protein
MQQQYFVLSIIFGSSSYNEISEVGPTANYILEAITQTIHFRNTLI